MLLGKSWPQERAMLRGRVDGEFRLIQRSPEPSQMMLKVKQRGSLEWIL